MAPLRRGTVIGELTRVSNYGTRCVGGPEAFRACMFYTSAFDMGGGLGEWTEIRPQDKHNFTGRFEKDGSLSRLHDKIAADPTRYRDAAGLSGASGMRAKRARVRGMG